MPVGRLISVSFAAFGVWLGVAFAQVPEGRSYFLHSPAAGVCPLLDWHIVVEANDVSAGLIAWNDMRTMAWATGQTTPFYNMNALTYAESHSRLAYLKDVIENKGGHKLFYHDGLPARRYSPSKGVIRKLGDGSDGGYGVALNAAHGTDEHPSVAPSHDRPLGQQDWGSRVHRGREPCGATMSLLWGHLRAVA